MKNSIVKSVRYRLGLFLFAPVLFLAVALGACSNVMGDEDIQANLQESQGEDEERTNPCAGANVKSHGTVDLIPAGGYIDYDFALSVTIPPFAVVEPCHCQSTFIKASLNIALGDLERVGTTYSVGGEAINIVYASDPGGGGGGPGDFKTASLDFTYDGGDLILVKLKEGVVMGGATAASIVNYVDGICIVDVIHDPHG